MKIVVAVKQVPDTETKLKLKNDASGIDEASIKWVMNPYDEFAVEEGIKLKATLGAEQVHVVTIGPQVRASDSLRTALALGADEASIIDASTPLSSLQTAAALAEFVKGLKDVGLVLAGYQAIDDSQMSVPLMLAQILGWPGVSPVSNLRVEGKTLYAQRELQGGQKEILRLDLPAVIAATKGLNQPRYASLPGIMKAKKKNVNSIAVAELLASHSNLPHTVYENFQLPPERKPPHIFNQGDTTKNVSDLVAALKSEAKVL